jgi:hypothetical protein
MLRTLPVFVCTAILAAQGTVVSPVGFGAL